MRILSLDCFSGGPNIIKHFSYIPPATPNEMESITPAVLVAGAAATIIAMASIHRKIREIVSRNAMRDLSDIYSAMIRVVNKTAADRFLILGIHNGGRDVTPHSRRYITIFEEANNGEVKAIRGDYDKFQVDGSYIQIFRRLMEEKHISGPVSSLAPGMLRDAYEADGLKFYHLFYICYRARVHFFCSISSTASPMEGPMEWSEISIAVQKIRSLMMKRRLI